LATPVVVGDAVELALGDLDVKTMHTVELHLEIGNTCAFAFPRFKLE
jgi:hypothetical protein